MSEGKIQQLGTPDDVYNDPANIFVAGFIGSPPMNLIKGDISGQVFTAPNTTVPMKKAADRKNVVLGVRPEDISVAKAGTGHLHSKLYSLEPTGDQTLVAAFSGDQLVVAKGARDFRQALDSDISLSFDLKRVYLFDEATGERIR